ncbi:uncharacterized protein [Amphiura filiformis]|uniref:uncharacterized protein n=1 Tax=Amphiura filiformis TaxID=82378 RepID=UPI003B22043F
MAQLLLWCLILLTCFGHTTAQAELSQWVTNNRRSNGPVVKVSCKSDNPVSFTWEFSDKTLAIDGRLTDADPSRYSVRVRSVSGPNRGYGSLLEIRNALKQDAGLYTCTAGYDTSHQTSSNITVIIDQYLPPPGYPVCTIDPSTTLIDNTDATFMCIAGESSPPVNLTLILQRQDGISVELGHGNVTRTITIEDNNAVFVCCMTSDTFPTAPQRNCSAGPITVIPKPDITTISLISTQTQQSRYGSESTTLEINTGAGIIGGVVGAIFLVLIITIIIITMYKKNKPLNENTTMTLPANDQQVSSAEHTYMAYQRGRPTEQEPYAEFNQTNVSQSTGHQSPSADHTYMAYQKGTEQEPYADLNQIVEVISSTESLISTKTQSAGHKESTTVEGESKGGNLAATLSVQAITGGVIGAFIIILLIIIIIFVILALTLKQHNCDCMVVMKMAASILWCMILLTYFDHTTAQVKVGQWSTNEVDIGPIVNVFCYSSSTTIPTFYTWTFSNKTIASNDTLIDANPSRYSVTMQDVQNTGYGSLLEIRNALKQDAGMYTCSIPVMTGSNSSDSSIQVIINQYLPPSMYPECIINPSTMLLNNTDATFICIAGESSLPVNLRLTLQRPDGTSIKLRDGNATRTVTIEDNGAVFVCHMTSDTFPTAQRNCSAGPITVSGSETKSTTKSALPMDTKGLTEMSSTSLEKTFTKPSGSTTQSSAGGIVGGIVSVILVLILLIIIIIVIIRKKKQTPPDSANNSLPTLSENKYSQEMIANSKNNEASPTKSQPDHQASSNQSPDHNITGQMPVYVNTSNDPGQSSGNPVADDQEDESDFPMYHTVKGNETTKDQVSNHKSQKDSKDSKGAETDNIEDKCPVYGKVNKGYKNSENEDQAAHKECSGAQGAENKDHDDAFPVYGKVNKGYKNTENEDQAGHKECEDSQGAETSNQENTEFPVYGKVNKGNKTVECEEDGNRESSGFVDNIIYISAGPH